MYRNCLSRSAKLVPTEVGVSRIYKRCFPLAETGPATKVILIR